MKNLLLTVAMILSTIGVFAQAPQAINYQAVVRNATGDVIKNQNVRFKLSITEGVAGTTTYAETQQATTSNLGLVNLTIGSGTVATGTFSAVNWATGSKFLKIEIDATGGTTYALMGTQQLVSVPYALHAATSGAVTNQWQFNSSGINYNLGKVGIGNSNPTKVLDIQVNSDLSGAGDDRFALKINNISTSNSSQAGLTLNAGNSLNETTLSHVASSYSIYPGFSDFGQLRSTGSGLILQASKTNGLIKFQTGGIDERMRIEANGNVGIGTTTPNYALHIERNADEFNNPPYDSRALLYVLNTSTSNSANTYIKVGSSGTTASTNLINYPPSYSVVPGYANCGLLSNNGSGLILQSVQPIRFKVGDNPPDRMVIAASGNVGIGTSTPVAKLQVTSGDVYIDDNTKGIIMKSPNGNCWRVTVDNTGNLVRTAITCPN